MIKRLLFVLLVLTIIPTILGCPGNSGRDKEYRDATVQWIKDSSAAGFQIPGWEGTPPQDFVLEVRQRPARIDFAIDPTKIHPLAQRNLIETVARYWRDKYPINMRPRFELHVYIYDKQISNDKEIGFTSIDKDGNVDTHHGPTQDMM